MDRWKACIVPFPCVAVFFPTGFSRTEVFNGNRMWDTDTLPLSRILDMEIHRIPRMWHSLLSSDGGGGGPDSRSVSSPAA